ncbi:hypothetical protein BC938DRAFT_472927 [Jimgerdemannia flammicorona]|uniref:Uncharacterized protein n=1 Tax=Jimgerdemannia flammicorona TaxID=994334 RepID=A0A433QTR1_9FUNG|nr:hypothetical protein BC938DRAFT_472927 [Jimgerdemannia flammicorona]
MYRKNVRFIRLIFSFWKTIPLPSHRRTRSDQPHECPNYSGIAAAIAHTHQDPEHKGTPRYWCLRSGVRVKCGGRTIRKMPL